MIPVGAVFIISALAYEFMKLLSFPSPRLLAFFFAAQLGSDERGRGDG